MIDRMKQGIEINFASALCFKVAIGRTGVRDLRLPFVAPPRPWLTPDNLQASKVRSESQTLVTVFEASPAYSQAAIALSSGKVTPSGSYALRASSQGAARRPPSQHASGRCPD
jgi:hypothetical protein